MTQCIKNGNRTEAVNGQNVSSTDSAANALEVTQVVDNQLLSKCPVCSSDQLSHLFNHERWNVQCFKCITCTHVFSSLYVDEKEDVITTNRLRAEFYFQTLEKIRFKSVLDIGSPGDFYFLNRFHQESKNTKLYSLDINRKNCPSHITLVHNFDEVKIELCTAFHIMEHKVNPHEFINSLLEASQYFIIEVPDCDTIDNIQTSSRMSHTHFFNIKSFYELFTGHEVNVNILRRSGNDIPPRRTALVAYSLPIGLKY